MDFLCFPLEELLSNTLDTHTVYNISTLAKVMKNYKLWFKSGKRVSNVAVILPILEKGITLVGLVAGMFRQVGVPVIDVAG